MARGLGVCKATVRQHLVGLGLPTSTPRSRRSPANLARYTFVDRAKAREAARKGGLAKGKNLRASRGIVPPPFTGTILDMMDLAELTGPTWDAWRSFLRAVYALPMGVEDLERFQRHTGRQAPPPVPVREAWMVVGRRGGKSGTAALAALFQAIRRDWRALFTRGERLVLPVLAADKDQAQAVLDYLRALLELPAFEAWKWKEKQEAIALRNGVTIRVKAASFRGVRGFTLIGAVLDEVAFWYSDERSSNPDTEILRALRPGLLKVPDAMILGLSSPYAARGELYKAYQRFTGVDDPRGLAWNADTLSMHPTADPQEIAQAFVDDPVAAASEYGQGGSVAFRRDIEGFLDWEAVRAVTASGLRELPPMDGVVYTAFVDVSGGAGDSFTLAITHREEEMVVLDLVREWRAPFSPKEVVKECAGVVEPYRVTYVTGDYYGGEWPRERFAEHGVGYERSERTKSDLYREMLPLINSQRVQLLDAPRLGAQLVGLERRVSRGGRDSVDHAPGGHDDVANATAGALVLAAEGLSSRAKDPEADREMTWAEMCALEYERTCRSKPHPAFDPSRKVKNLEVGVT
jgi:hypothetical protein